MLKLQKLDISLDIWYFEFKYPGLNSHLGRIMHEHTQLNSQRNKLGHQHAFCDISVKQRMTKQVNSFAYTSCKITPSETEFGLAQKTARDIKYMKHMSNLLCCRDRMNLKAPIFFSTGLTEKVRICAMNELLFHCR